MTAVLLFGLGLGAILVFAGPLRHALVRLVWRISPPFKVGDAVTVGENSGVVEAIGWQRVRLRGVSGNRFSLPNAWVAEQPVVRSVSESGSQGVDMLFPVPEGTDPGLVKTAAERAVVLSPYLALDRPIAVALEQEDRGGIRVRVRAGVFDSSLRVSFETSIIEIFRTQLKRGNGDP